MIASHTSPPQGIIAITIAIATFLVVFTICYLRAMRRVRASLFDIAASFGWRDLQRPFFSSGQLIRGTHGDGRRLEIAYVVEGKNGPRTLLIRAGWTGTSKFLLRRGGNRIAQMLSKPFDIVPPRVNSPVPLPPDVDLRADDPMLVERLLGNGDLREQLFEAIPRWLDEIRIGRGWVRVRREIVRVADPSRGSIQISLAPSEEQFRTIAGEEWAIVRAVLHVAMV